MHLTVALLDGKASLDPVQVHIAADHGSGDGDGIVLQPKQCVQLFAGLGGVFTGNQADHIKDIRLQILRAHLHNQTRGDLGIATGGGQFVHFIFQQKQVLSAALQQKARRAFAHDGVHALRPLSQHETKLLHPGMGYLGSVAQFLTSLDQLFGLLGQLQLAPFLTEDTVNNKHRIFGAGQHIAEFSHILFRIGRRLQHRQLYDPAGTEKRDGARRHNQFLHRGGGTVQPCAFSILLQQGSRCFFCGRPGQERIGRIIIENRHALFQRSLLFLFRMQHWLPPRM